MKIVIELPKPKNPAAHSLELSQFARKVHKTAKTYNRRKEKKVEHDV